MSLNRRSFLAAAAAVAGTAVTALAQRDYSSSNPVHEPDPDIISLDKRFDAMKVGNTAIHRLYTGCMWAEGPAWNGVGRYLVFSDVPNNVQMRYADEDGHVSVFRKPSGYSNGNTFDYEGRELSCEQDNRRIVRYEYDGSITVLADNFQGKKLNSPNDIVVHPDGGIFFTDPGYGIITNYEGHVHPMELKEAVYRIDPKTGKVDKLTDELFKPNGLCFTPDFKKLYISDTGSTHYPQAPKVVRVYDVVNGSSLANGKVAFSTELKSSEFSSLDSDSKSRLRAGAGIVDGFRCDKQGNLWCATGWVGQGYDGVHVFSPEGQRLGVIVLPEIPSNVCFGGEKRNRLFVLTGSSVYAVYVNAQGASNC
jgi:gluconolactonase